MPATRERSPRREAAGVHIFTRDLRLNDNRSLTHLASATSSQRLVFVFTPEQTRTSPYFNERSFAFLLGALEDLSAQLARMKNAPALEVFFGSHVDVLDALHSAGGLGAVSIARDYTPYAKDRAKRVDAWCAEHRVPFHEGQDHAAADNLDDIRSGTGTKYKVFTPFYKNAVARPFQKPIAVPKLTAARAAPLKNKKLHYSLKQAAAEFVKDPALQRFAALADPWATGGTQVRPTRQWALDRLAQYKFDAYDACRDDMAQDCTLLSSHLKFGLVSAREARVLVEARTECKKDARDSFVRELFWRDFYLYLTGHFEWILAGQRSPALAKSTGAAFDPTAGKCTNQNFTSQYPISALPWNEPKKDDALVRWQEGKTGVPLVDACMRELNATGFMHNRGRMVVAMFLTKNLMIDWRWGELYFARTLMDYCPCSNNGGWQWSSSTGADSTPYFRIMNPMSQLAKQDKTKQYTKKWLDPVKELTPQELDKWDEDKTYAKITARLNGKMPAALKAYPRPMVDLKKSRQAAIAAFKAAGARG